MLQSLRHVRTSTGLSAVLAVTLGLGGCGSNLASLQISMPEGVPAFSGSQEEIYSRIARGVLGCWFGANGPLKPTHIFHADLPPADKGSPAEIVIHERDQISGNPRGLKAMRITLAPRSETTIAVQVEPVRFPGESGQKMRASIERWAGGEPACEPPAAQGWQPVAQAKPASPPPKTKGPQKK